MRRGYIVSIPSPLPGDEPRVLWMSARDLTMFANNPLFGPAGFHVTTVTEYDGVAELVRGADPTVRHPEGYGHA